MAYVGERFVASRALIDAFHVTQRLNGIRFSLAGESKNASTKWDGINTWVTTGTILALTRLAQRYGVTQREMLERLVAADDEEIVSRLVGDFYTALHTRKSWFT